MSWWTDEAGRDDSDVDETIDRAAFVAGLPADSPSPAAAESPLNDPFHTPYPTTAFNQAPSTSPDADGADRPYNWYEGMGKASGTAGSVPAYPSATSEAFRSTARLEQQVQAPPPFPSPSLHQTHAAVPQQPAPRTQQMPVATPGNPMGLAPGAAPAGSFQQVPPPPSGPYSAVPNYGQVINSEAYASFGQRFAALLIDGLFTSIVLAAIVVAAGVGVGAAVASAAGAKVRSDDLIFFALIAYIAGSSLGSAAYFLIGLSRGQTLGLQSMGIRLCRESGAPLGIWRVIGRNMVSILSALPLMAGYFAPLWSPKRQTWHDSIMGTVVVRDNVSRLARKAVVWGVVFAAVVGAVFGALGGAITAEIGPFGNGSSYSISDDSYVDSFGYDGEGDSYDADDTDSLSVNDESAAYDSEGDADGYTEPTHNSSGDNQYAAAIASSLTEDEFMNVSQSQAECFGQGTVGIIGLQQLEQSSLTALDLELFPFDYQALGLSQSQGLEIYDQFRSCDIDIHAALKEGASAVTEMYAALLPGLADTTSFRSCMTDIFDDRTLMRNYMAQIMTRGQEAAMNDRSAGSLAAAVNERC